MSFKAPVRDLAFALEAAGFDRLSAAFPNADPDTVDAVLNAAGDFAAEVLAPLNRTGDLTGVSYANGKVTAAAGFAEAYRRFAADGWTSLAADSAHGGQGLPRALGQAVCEMVQAANLSFSLCPILSQGAADAIEKNGSDEQKALYLPKLVSGEWTGTMNLTEPQAGSDLAGVATRAEPDGEGGYRLTGQKIFITWGDHDLADNIVHLVLARLPDAPAGSRGLSLFVAPKRLLDKDGALGPQNALRPGSIEHKLGLHGSPTCVMLFEGAKAELVGAPNAGLAGMFVMMNAARLQVGSQGVAIAERAYQQALAYALERQQGRSAWTGDQPARIFDHPDVRRALMLTKARIEAGRGLCLATAVAADLARVGADEAERQAAELREALLTPIAKAWCTDMGVEAASAGVQIHGGMGFIEATGAAQYYRDARILPIYEGTNGIQAIDLVGRKLALADGKAVSDLFGEIAATAAVLKATTGLEGVGARLQAALAAARSAVDWITPRRDAPDGLAGATLCLKLLGDVVAGWLLGKGALLVEAKLAGGVAPTDYLRTKVGLARLFAEQTLSGAPGLAQAIASGAAELATATPEGLGA
ncbi:MAG: acyl-CoA dehydrogenase [Caulobacteraceae bacterium]|nr:acyl-CoA dehydrogenase [Caulobacteraceae bacterium]